jgi:hypothetical protein
MITITIIMIYKPKMETVWKEEPAEGREGKGGNWG